MGGCLCFGMALFDMGVAACWLVSASETGWIIDHLHFHDVVSFRKNEWRYRAKVSNNMVILPSHFLQRWLCQSFIPGGRLDFFNSMMLFARRGTSLYSAL